MQTNIEQHEKFILPSGQEIDKDNLTPDIAILQQRITDIFGVLLNFQNEREEGKKRKDYMKLLIRDLAAYYSYNEYLIQKFLEILPLSEVKNYYCRYNI